MLWILVVVKSELRFDAARCSSVSFFRLLLISKTSKVVSLKLHTTLEVFKNLNKFKSSIIFPHQAHQPWEFAQLQRVCSIRLSVLSV